MLWRILCRIKMSHIIFLIFGAIAIDSQDESSQLGFSLEVVVSRMRVLRNSLFLQIAISRIHT